MMCHNEVAVCCISCRLRPAECVCAYAPHLELSTRLFVIMHSKEWRKTTNTGHLARLAVRGGVVRRHGLPHRSVSGADIDAAAPSTLVLYPGRGAQALTPAFIASLQRPLTLLVPDGNWNQVKHMMRRVPMLSQAQPVRLECNGLGPAGLRRNRCADRMSTFEAIAHALGVLENPETEALLLAFFQQFLKNGIHNSRRGARFNQALATTLRGTHSS